MAIAVKPETISSFLAAVIAFVAAIFSAIFARSSKQATAKELLTNRFLTIENERIIAVSDSPTTHSVYARFWLHQHDQFNFWLNGLVPTEIYYLWLLRRLADWHHMDVSRCALFRSYYIEYRAMASRFPDGQAFVKLHDMLFGIADPPRQLILDGELRRDLRAISCLRDFDALAGLTDALEIPDFAFSVKRVALFGNSHVFKQSLVHTLRKALTSHNALVWDIDSPLLQVLRPLGYSMINEVQYAAASVAFAEESTCIWKAACQKKELVVITNPAFEVGVKSGCLDNDISSEVEDFFRLSRWSPYDLVLILPCSVAEGELDVGASPVEAAESPSNLVSRSLIRYLRKHTISSSTRTIAGYQMEVLQCSKIGRSFVLLPEVGIPVMQVFCQSFILDLLSQPCVDRAAWRKNSCKRD